MDSSDEDLPESILEEAKIANLGLLPAKSRHRYEKEYAVFTNWCQEKGIKSMKEEVFLAYFSELNKVCKPNTLWSRYSMLKSVIKIKNDLDISKFFKVTSYIKRQNVGFRPKKAKVFNKEEVTKFLNEAPDEVYLMIKVVAIFGLAGACRRDELTKMTIDDIEERENLLIIRIPDSKNHTSRTFVISDEINNGNVMSLYRKYINLRKPNTPHRRFFVFYKKGHCTVQCVGVNTFGKIPSEIAAYLKLPNPHLYTGHSFRRSSASILADSGEEITSIKRLGGWKSTSVAEGYLEESTKHKKDISNKILGMNIPSNSLELDSETYSNIPSSYNQSTVTVPSSNQLASAIKLQNASNCTFNINIVNNQ